MDHAYEILGCNKNESNEAIKRKYRVLAKDYHPDRLVGMGLPKEFVDLANDRLAKINSAYDVISSKRGIK